MSLSFDSGTICLAAKEGRREGRKEIRRNDTKEHSPEKNPNSAKSYHSSKFPITPNVHNINIEKEEGEIAQNKSIKRRPITS